MAIMAACMLPEIGAAQYFTYSSGDMLLGFRKTTGSAPYDLVVDIGSVTNYLALPPGTKVSISQFSSSQLADAFSDFNNLQWSASAAWGTYGSWAGFPLHTMWVTVPRDNPNSQTSPPARQSSGGQQTAVNAMASIGTAAANSVSPQFAGPTGPDNNTTLVREPTGSSYDRFDYHTFVEDPFTPAIGDFDGYLPWNAENTTPAAFTNTPVVSDLYQSIPTGFVDPYTGTNSGPAYYVGHFTLNPNGTMTFTRASVAAPQPPPPQIVSLSRSGDTSTIYFTTTNGTFTYTLYHTNAAGLTAPVTNWPASPTTLIGNGSTNHLSDTTTDPSRFYRIGVQ